MRLLSLPCLSCASVFELAQNLCVSVLQYCNFTLHTAGGASGQFLLGNNGLDYAAIAPYLHFYDNYRALVTAVEHCGCRVTLLLPNADLSAMSGCRSRRPACTRRVCRPTWISLPCNGAAAART